MSSRAARLVLAAATVALVLGPAGPARAANPVFDPEDDAEIAASLAEATEVQDVCYGYALDVQDEDTGEWSGSYASSSAGEGVRASETSACSEGVVELVARITYTSSYSEAEDSAAWDLRSTLPGVDIAAVEDLGLSSGDLLSDDDSATTLQNAVLALPRLAAERAGRPPVVLEPNPSPLPAGARPTGTPGSDWLRENSALLLVCVGAVLAGVLLLVTSLRAGRNAGSHWASGGPRPPRVRSFGPPAGPRPGPPSPDPWSS